MCSIVANGKKSSMHYGLKLTVSKFSNFPLLNPSQIAPKFYSLVEQCRAKNSTWFKADSISDEPYAKICLSKCEEIELIGFNWFLLLCGTNLVTSLFQHSVRSAATICFASYSAWQTRITRNPNDITLLWCRIQSFSEIENNKFV